MSTRRQCSGLRDKIYWRAIGYCIHAFKKYDAGGYVSLCGEFRRARSGGQGCMRPPPEWRCARCDGLEMRRRGWDESGPTSPDWRALQEGVR